MKILCQTHVAVAVTIHMRGAISAGEASTLTNHLQAVAEVGIPTLPPRQTIDIAAVGQAAEVEALGKSLTHQPLPPGFLEMMVACMVVEI